MQLLIQQEGTNMTPTWRLATYYTKVHLPQITGSIPDFVRDHLGQGMGSNNVYLLPRHLRAPKHETDPRKPDYQAGIAYRSERVRPVRTELERTLRGFFSEKAIHTTHFDSSRGIENVAVIEGHITRASMQAGWGDRSAGMYFDITFGIPEEGYTNTTRLIRVPLPPLQDTFHKLDRIMEDNEIGDMGDLGRASPLGYAPTIPVLVLLNYTGVNEMGPDIASYTEPLSIWHYDTSLDPLRNVIREARKHNR